MLTYIFLFALILLLIVGMTRVTKRTQATSPRVHTKEPFMGAMLSEAQDDIVGEPRIIHAAHPHKKQDVPEENSDREPSILTEESGAIAAAVPISQEPLFLEKVSVPTQEKNVQTDDVIVLHLLAQPAQSYRGYELLQALRATGMRYGKWEIFHYHMDAADQGTILFSLASGVEPGTFDLANMRSFATPALTLFMRISSVENPAETFETLLSTGRQLVKALGGTLCDEKRLPITIEKLARWRMQL
jgi:cell division protein ZipA